jgi:MYXO-CTERM domain-containing protein
MRRSLTLAALVGCATPATSEHGSPLINGTTPTGLYPAVGALFYDGVFEGELVSRVACSGTLIAPNVVLTAAHCLDPYITDMVGLPSFVLDDDATAANATFTPGISATLHEDYVSQTVFHIFFETPNDIALLVLAEPITGVEPLEIRRTPPEVNLALAVTGYGQTVAGDDSTVGIEHTTSTTITELGDTEFRLLAVGDPLPCIANGDSGGPAIDGESRIAGIVSHFGGETEACESGGIFERVDVYADWIDEHQPVTSGGGGCSSTHSGGWLAALAIGASWRRRRRTVTTYSRA